MAKQIRIGGSDIPTLLGINPFKTYYDLLLEKSGYQDCPFEANEYTKFGIDIEPKIRNFVNETYYKEDIFKVDDKWENDKGFVSKVDGKNSNKILEIKSTSKVEQELSGYRSYLVQLLFYMWRYDIDEGVLAVYARPADFDTTFCSGNLQIFSVVAGDYQSEYEEISKAIMKFWVNIKQLESNPFLLESELI